MPDSLVSQRVPVIVGHRGAMGLAPENTLAAFQVAVELGIDGVEFDIQRTRDGHVIVFHDEDVARTTHGTGRVNELTLAEIKSLDAGVKFDAKYQGERIPTLRETFEFLRPTQLLLHIELKDPWCYPGLEAELVTLIHEYDLVERVQVRTFYHDALYTMYQLAPEIALSELWFERLPGDEEVTFRTINGLFQLYTPENIAQIHRRGQLATAWVVNSIDMAHELVEAGIDGLTTDYPDRLLTLVDGLPSDESNTAG